MATPARRLAQADPSPAGPQREVRKLPFDGKDAALIRQACATLAAHELHRDRLSALLSERHQLLQRRRELFAEFKNQGAAIHSALDAAFRQRR